VCTTIISIYDGEGQLQKVKTLFYITAIKMTILTKTTSLHCHWQTRAVTHAHCVVNIGWCSVWWTGDRDRHQFTSLTDHLSWQHLKRSAVPEIRLVPTKI